MRWREQITGRPLALLAASAVIGIVLADHIAAPRNAALILLLCALLVAVLTWFLRQWRWPVLLAAIVFALIHTHKLEDTRRHPLRTELLQRTAPLMVEATGRIEQPLRSDLPGVDPGQATFVATRIRSLLDGRVWSGPVTLQLFPGQDASPPTGEYRILGRLRLPSPPDNPGQFDARTYQLRLGLTAQLVATQMECLRADRWNLWSFLARSADHCRDWVTNVLHTDLDGYPNERAVILAMALGTIDDSNRHLEKPFRESGTLHIFAVSGLHVAIVGAIFWALLRPLGLRRRVLVPVLIFALFGYAFLTGMRPSAIRAAIMASVLLLGMGFHRRTDLLNSLGAAALILLAHDTQQVFMPGFQLSFFVLAAIALFVKLFTRPLLPWIDPDPLLPKPLLTNWQKSVWSFRRGLVGLFTVSAAAALGSLPLILWHFHLVTPISLLANAALVPLSFLVLGTALLTLLFGLLHLGPVQMLLSNANLAFAWCAMQAAQFFAGIPGGSFQVGHESPLDRPPASLTVLRLPAGAGAQHLRLGGTHWLFDTGPLEDFPFVLLPYLQYSGVDRLHGLVLSHGDYEHIGATLRMQQEFGHPQTWEPAREPWRWDTGRSSFRILHSQGLRASPLSQGDSLDLGDFDGHAARATTLYPTLDLWPRRGDDRSLVLRLDLSSFRILWCNDAGFLAEKTMLATLPRDALRCDILIRNQHASDISLTPEFLDATHPRILISSNDDFPPEQKLPQRLRDDCAIRKIQLLDQAETGAVTLRIWPEKIILRAMRNLEEMTLHPR